MSCLRAGETGELSAFGINEARELLGSTAPYRYGESFKLKLESAMVECIACIKSSAGIRSSPPPFGGTPSEFPSYGRLSMLAVRDKYRTRQNQSSFSEGRGEASDSALS